MSVTFQREPFWPWLEEAQPLLARHFDEIAENKALHPRLDLDFTRYKMLDAAGKLHVLTARDDGKLVGYYIAQVDHNLHYRHVVAGTDDAHYLAPEYRKGRTGIRLFIAAEAMMREIGVMIGIARVKEAHNHGAILQRLGWRPFERVYCKIMR